jgi:hypothetical protein
MLYVVAFFINESRWYAKLSHVKWFRKSKEKRANQPYYIWIYLFDAKKKNYKEDHAPMATDRRKIKWEKSGIHDGGDSW